MKFASIVDHPAMLQLKGSEHTLATDSLLREVNSALQAMQQDLEISPG